MSHAIQKKRYLRFAPWGPAPRQSQRLLRRLRGLANLPIMLPAAWLAGAPGLRSRLRCIPLGLQTLVTGGLRDGIGLIDNPMDSFRYVEVEAAVDAARARQRIDRYLDVSSPRLVPLLILKQHRRLVADLLNPSDGDLRDTMELARRLRVKARCRFHGELIGDWQALSETFDLITSMSVVEHIPNDTEAVAAIWRLLRPGGTLVVSVPCAAQACEEYTNVDEYELLERDGDGFVYWQRYYDDQALAERIFTVTGEPFSKRIIGERRPGSYDENVRLKRTDPTYPYWREPLMMGRDYTLFERIDSLPGMGVIVMTFVKPESRP